MNITNHNIVEEKIIEKFCLNNVLEFDGPPIHLHLLNNGKKTFRIKKY